MRSARLPAWRRGGSTAIRRLTTALGLTPQLLRKSEVVVVVSAAQQPAIDSLR